MSALGALANLFFAEPGFLPRFFKTFGAATLAAGEALVDSFFGPVFLAISPFLVDRVVVAR